MRRIIATIIFILCLPFLVLSLLLIYLIFIIASLFGEGFKRKVSTAIYFSWGRLAVYSTLSRITVVGRERLPYGKPMVIYSNHASFFDIPILSGFVIPSATYAARKGLAISPIIVASGGVLLDRKSSRSELKNIREIVRRIKAGRPFIIFPEGTRSHSDEIGDLKSGSIKIAQWAKAYAVPVRIEGTRDLLPRGAYWPKPAEVRVVIGEPFSPDDMLNGEILSKMKSFFENDTD